MNGNDLTEEHLAELRRIALGIAGQFPTLDVDDIVQEAVIRLLENPWKYRAKYVRRAALDLVRQERRADLPVGAVANVPALTDDPDVKLDIRRALGQLSMQQRQVAILYGMYGWPLDAIASRLDLGRATIWRRWKEARANLERTLETYAINS